MNIKDIIQVLIDIALLSGFNEAKEQYFKEKDPSDTTTPSIYFANSDIDYSNQLLLSGLRTYTIQAMIYIDNCPNVSSFDFDTLINAYINKIKSYCVDYEFRGLLEGNKIILSKFERIGEKYGILYFNITN